MGIAASCKRSAACAIVGLSNVGFGKTDLLSQYAENGYLREA